MKLLSKLERYKDFGLLLMRLGLGALMIMHGYPKIIGGPEKWISIGGSMKNLGVNFFPGFWGFMAALAEALGGLMVILGFYFRPACLFILFTMVVASIDNMAGGEGLKGASHAMELGFTFLGLMFIGAGKFSVDKN